MLLIKENRLINTIDIVEIITIHKNLSLKHKITLQEICITIINHKTFY